MTDNQHVDDVQTEITTFDQADDFISESIHARIVMVGQWAHLPDRERISGRKGTAKRNGDVGSLVFPIELPANLIFPANEDDIPAFIQNLDEHLGAEFNSLNKDLNLKNGFLTGNSDNWYSLVVSQDPTAERTDYRPTMFVDYNLALVRFCGRAPEITRLESTVCRGLLQWRAMENAIDGSRKAVAIAEGSSARDLRKHQDSLSRARHELLVSIVSFDPRMGCYEFLDFEFADRIRRTWHLDALESMAQWALDACRERLQVISDAQQEASRKSLRIILAVLTVASALTAVLAAVDFSTSDTPLDADSLARILTAGAVIAIAIVVGVQLHRKGVG